MSGLVPYGGQFLPSGQQRAFELARRIERQHGELAADRLRAISMVTEVALWHVAQLSALEGNLIKQVPLAESRLGAIVDVAAGAMAAEIARLGMRSG